MHIVKKTAAVKNNQVDAIEKSDNDVEPEIEDMASEEVISKVLHVSDDFDVYVDPEEDEDVLPVPYATSDDDEDYY